MKRVCFFEGSMDHGGGTERMTQLIANALSDDEYQVFVLSKSDKYHGSYFPLNKKIKYSVLDNKPYHGKMTLLKDILLLFVYLKKNKIDILISVDVMLGLFSFPMRVLIPKLKLIYWDHFSSYYDSESRHMLNCRKTALRIGKFYITLTEEDKETLNDQFCVNCSIKAIPNVCHFNITSNRYDIESKRIISVGNLLNVKGFDLAIESAKEVFTLHPDWKWIIYGDGIEEDNLLRRIKELHLESFIILAGRCKDIENEYKNSSLFVLTSRSEGFGLVIAEAQAAGCLPVIAFDVPFGPRQMISDGVNGFLIQPFDTALMARRINWLIENNMERKRMADNAQIHLCRFSMESVLKSWKEVLEQC